MSSLQNVLHIQLKILIVNANSASAGGASTGQLRIYFEAVFV